MGTKDTGYIGTEDKSYKLIDIDTCTSTDREIKLELMTKYACPVSSRSCRQPNGIVHHACDTPTGKQRKCGTHRSQYTLLHLHKQHRRENRPKTSRGIVAMVVRSGPYVIMGRNKKEEKNDNKPEDKPRYPGVRAFSPTTHAWRPSQM